VIRTPPPGTPYDTLDMVVEVIFIVEIFLGFVTGRYVGMHYKGRIAVRGGGGGGRGGGGGVGEGGGGGGRRRAFNQRC
jgi:hypothetical protein